MASGVVSSNGMSGTPSSKHSLASTAERPSSPAPAAQVREVWKSLHAAGVRCSAWFGRQRTRAAVSDRRVSTYSASNTSSKPQSCLAWNASARGRESNPTVAVRAVGSSRITVPGAKKSCKGVRDVAGFREYDGRIAGEFSRDAAGGLRHEQVVSHCRAQVAAGELGEAVVHAVRVVAPREHIVAVSHRGHHNHRVFKLQHVVADPEVEAGSRIGGEGEVPQPGDEVFDRVDVVVGVSECPLTPEGAEEVGQLVGDADRGVGRGQRRMSRRQPLRVPRPDDRGCWAYRRAVGPRPSETGQAVGRGSLP